MKIITIASPFLLAVALFTTNVYSQDWRNATSFSKVSLSHLSTRQRSEALKMLREEGCPCGCGMKLAQCLVDDPSCPVSPRLGKQVALLAARNHSALSITRGIWFMHIEVVKRNVSKLVPVGGTYLEASRADPNVVYYAHERCSERFMCKDCSKWHRKIGPTPSSWPLDYAGRLGAVLATYRSAGWLVSEEIAEAEDNIIGQLNRIDRFQGTNEELHRSLATDLENGFEAFDRAVVRHFKSLGKSALLAPRLSCAAPAGPFSGGIEVTTSPAKAELFYLDEDRFDIIFPLKMVNSNRRVWDDLGKTNGVFRRKLPPGKYRVYAWWPGVRRYAYSRMLTISNSTVRVSLSAN